MIWMLVGAALALAAMFGWTRWRVRRRSLRAMLWRQLRTRTVDPALVRRRMEVERERDPDASALERLRRVVRRLMRDRR